MGVFGVELPQAIQHMILWRGEVPKGEEVIRSTIQMQAENGQLAVIYLNGFSVQHLLSRMALDTDFGQKSMGRLYVPNR